MCVSFPRFFRIIGIALFVFALALSACSGRQEVTAKSFVGKWRSSRLVTPLYLYENGEWEIKNDEGAVLQYGVWQYKDNAIVWSFRKSGTTIGHDVNQVLAAKPKEFQLKESDESVTTFVRLDAN